MANYNTILYLFDDKAKAREGWPPGSRVIVVPITSDYGLIESVIDAINQSGQAELIDYAELFNRKAFALRDDFLKFMAEIVAKPLFRGESFKEALVRGGHNFSLWWLSPVAEKNTMASGAYARLTALAAIADIRARYNCDEIRLDIADSQLVAGLRLHAAALKVHISDVGSRRPRPAWRAGRSFARAVVHIGKVSVKMIQARWSMRGTRPLEAMGKARYLLVTYFPLCDKEAWARGQWLNKYYAPVQRELEEKYPGQTVWLALFARLDGFSWRQSLGLGRRVVAQGHSLSFFEQWLGPVDLAAVIVGAAAAAVKFARHRRALAREFLFRDGDLVFNVWPLFAADWYDSFYGPGLMKGLVNYRVCRRVMSRAAPGTTVLYIAEMLAWEKALNVAANEYPGLTVVGIQHTIVPLLLLSYFNHHTELRNKSRATGMPQPDYLACVGPMPLKLFLDCGWDPAKVFVWGALRFPRFRSYFDNKIAWKNRADRVIVALSISPGESMEVLRFVYHAFKDGVGYQVVVKGHPGCPVGPLLDSLGIDSDGRILTVSDSPLSDLLPTAKAMVVTESSSTLEGLADGCPVIVPRLTNFIDMNPLSGVSDLPVYANSPAELKSAIDAVVTGAESPLSDEACKRFIEEYCYWPGPEGFLTRLEALV